MGTQIELAFSGALGAVFPSAVSSESDCRSKGREFHTLSHYLALCIMRVYEHCRTPENVNFPHSSVSIQIELAFSVALGAVFASAVGSASDCRSRSREFEPHVGHITFVGTDYEIISRTDCDRIDSNFQTKVSTNQTTEGTEMRWCVLGGRPTSFWTDYNHKKTFSHSCVIFALYRCQFQS